MRDPIWPAIPEPPRIRSIYSAEPAAVAGSAAEHERSDDRSRADCGGGAGQGSGDSSNCGALAALGTQTIVNGLTPSDFYSNFVTALGSTVSEVQTENTAQTASVTQLQTHAGFTLRCEFE